MTKGIDLPALVTPTLNAGFLRAIVSWFVPAMPFHGFIPFHNHCRHNHNHHNHNHYSHTRLTPSTLLS